MSKQLITKIHNRSKKYSANFAKIQEALTQSKSNILSVEKAVEVLLSLDQPKFKEGASIELHFNLNIDSTKSDQIIRSSTILPHGTGTKVVVAAFVSPENVERAKKAGADLAGGDDLIEQIKNSGKVDFAKAIAEPEMMKKLPPIARILGTAGVMPNPKTGTVGENIEEMIKLIKSGKVDFRNDKSGNLHIICGKINAEFDAKKLVENIETAIDAVEKAKPEGVKKKYILSVHLATSQSPSVRIG